MFFCFFGWAGSGGLNTFTRFPNLVIALIHRCPHTPRLETQQWSATSIPQSIQTKGGATIIVVAFFSSSFRSVYATLFLRSEGSPCFQKKMGLRETVSWGDECEEKRIGFETRIRMLLKEHWDVWWREKVIFFTTLWNLYNIKHGNKSVKLNFRQWNSSKSYVVPYIKQEE